MSLDYPNRNDWLAVRETRPVRWRLVFDSGIGRAMRYGKPAIPPGRTYRAKAAIAKAAL